jgi:predicted nucleic acid-binding protein
VIVVDASAVLDGLLDAGQHEAIVRCLVGSTAQLAAPDLLDVEIVSVLRRCERHKEIANARAIRALDDLEALPVIRSPGRVLAQRAWRLRHNLTPYDAQYVALAQELAGELLTTDEGMAAAAAKACVKLHIP